MAQDVEETRIADATIKPVEQREIEIIAEMMAAGVDYLQGEVLTLVESESSRFESTIMELFRVMREARRLSMKQIPETP